MEATRQVSAGIDPDAPAEEVLILSSWQQLELVEAPAAYSLRTRETEIVIVRREVGQSVILGDIYLTRERPANDGFAQAGASGLLDGVLLGIRGG